MPEWLDVVQLVWLVGACVLCYFAGKNSGIRDTIHILMDNGVLTKEDLVKLDKKLQEDE